MRQLQTDEQIALALNTTTRTVERVRQRFVEESLEPALLPKPNTRVYTRKLDGKQEAKLVTLGLGNIPSGPG